MNIDNRRSEFRLQETTMLFVELRSDDHGSSTPAEILICSGIDLSSNGLQLHLDRPLPAGRILRLGAAPAKEQPAMYVVGEVRWSRHENHGWTVGIALFESDGTDIIAWKKFVAERLAS